MQMNVDSQQIHQRILQLYSDSSATGDDGKNYSIELYSVTPARGEFIRDTAIKCGAKSSLEVGMAWGLSSLCILEALVHNGAGDGAHVVIDAFQTEIFHNAALRSIRELGLASMVEFHEQRSEIALPELLAQGKKFDFAFVDGDHSFQAAFVDMFYANQMLKPGGVMVLDDVHFDPVYKVSRFMELTYRYEMIGEVVGAHRYDAGEWKGFGFAPKGGNGKSPARADDDTHAALERPCIRAYRKPTTDVRADYFDFVRFMAGDLNLPKPALRQQWHAHSRAGLNALRAGRNEEARRYFFAALGCDPSSFKTYLRLVRTFFPSSLARAASGRHGANGA